ncbi:MAG: riboflavin biosynthesis protein RibF [Pseudomonadota bacterium]
MKKVWTDANALGGKLAACAVTVGNFDGVHRGHQDLIRELVLRSRKLGVPSVAMMFDPHPSVILGLPGPPLLTRPMDRARMLYALDVEYCLIQPFSAALARLSARKFVEDLLISKLHMKTFCVGPTTHVGRAREGNPARLASLAGELGFEFALVSAVVVDGQLVSSSVIRKLLAEGDVEETTKLLGWTYVTRGKIVSGSGRGSKIGVPTANLENVSTLLPKRGVYATVLRAEGKPYRGATNVGLRPTFGNGERLTVETHALDFQGSLLGREVEIFWVKRLRDEVRFPDASELNRQIQRDGGEVRKRIPEPARGILELK